MHYLFCLLIFTSFVSGITISGAVKDAETDRPLENVNIIVNDSDIGSTTDKNGNFTIEDLQLRDTQLSFSMIGYKTFSKRFISKDKDQEFLTISLHKDPIQWKAINVMGLIPSKHSPEITEIVETKKTNNTDQETLSALLGNLHGIEVQSAQEHGRNVNVSIRGSSDFKPGGYNNRVLLLLDGFHISYWASSALQSGIQLNLGPDFWKPDTLT